MTAYEFVLAIKDYCEGDIKETIQEINDIVEGIENRGLLHSLIEEIEEIALDNNLCPNCSEELVIVKVAEEPSEYFGRPVTEDIYTKVCSECNYKVD